MLHQNGMNECNFLAQLVLSDSITFTVSISLSLSLFPESRTLLFNLSFRCFSSDEKRGNFANTSSHLMESYYVVVRNGGNDPPLCVLSLKVLVSQEN